MQIKDLYVSVEGQEILRGVNLVLKAGEINVLMGPNASGKSTLAFTIMGHPRYQVTKGDILFEGKSILKLSTDKRARLGIFLAFQNPIEVPGVYLFNFLRMAKKETVKKNKTSLLEFRQTIEKKAEELNVSPSLLQRPLNEGFSGGEKKRSEILQLAILEPKLAILDEIDSGLDVDGLRLIAQTVQRRKEEGMAVFLITHYQRLLKYLTYDYVFVMQNGRIVSDGGAQLVEMIERKGYGKWQTI